jgi:polar amino acid transport system substrate-binding protein
MLCATLLLLAACATHETVERSAGLTRIASTHELRIGMSGEQPPLTMTTRSGELIGLDVALARVLGQAMGVETRLVQMPFGELLGALEAGQVDLVMSGLTITPERAQRVTFVGPYYTSGKSILTRSPSLAAVKIPEALDRPELRLVVLTGSTSESFARRAAPRAQITAVPMLEQAIRMVREGEADALVADRETCAVASLRHPGEGLLAPDVVFTIEPMGIALASDDPRLARLVGTYLDALRERGVIEKARAYWLNDPAWVEELR